MHSKLSSSRVNRFLDNLVNKKRTELFFSFLNDTGRNWENVGSKIVWTSHLWEDYHFFSPLNEWSEMTVYVSVMYK